MKKTLALILALVMCIAALACAAPAAETAPAAAPTAESVPAAEATSAAEAAPAADAAHVGPSTNTTGVVDMTGISGEGMSAIFVISNLENPWCLAVSNGVEAACKDYGVEFTSLAFGNDVGKEIAAYENIANGSYNFMVTYPFDGVSEIPYIETMTGEGRPVIGVAGYSEALSGQIELNQYAYGENIGAAACEWINSTMNGVANVVILSEDKLEQSILRGNGIEDTVKKLCPNATIITRAACFTTEDGLDAMETLLTQRDDINCVIACNDTIGLGGYQALVNAGYSGREDVGVFSGDFTDDAVKYIKEGDIYRGSVDIEPYWSGYAAAEVALYQIANGIPDEMFVVPGAMSFTPQSEMVG